MNLARAKIDANDSGVSLQTESIALWLIIFVNQLVCIFAITLIFLNRNWKNFRFVYVIINDIRLDNTCIHSYFHKLGISDVCSSLYQLRLHVIRSYFYEQPLMDILASERNWVILVALFLRRARRPFNFLLLVAIGDFELLWIIYKVVTVFRARVGP